MTFSMPEARTSLAEINLTFSYSPDDISSYDVDYILSEVETVTGTILHDKKIPIMLGGAPELP